MLYQRMCVCVYFFLNTLLGKYKIKRTKIIVIIKYKSYQNTPNYKLASPFLDTGKGGAGTSGTSGFLPALLNLSPLIGAWLGVRSSSISFSLSASCVFSFFWLSFSFRRLVGGCGEDDGLV